MPKIAQIMMMAYNGHPKRIHLQTRRRPTVVLRRARTVPKAFQNKSPNVLRAHAVPEYTCPSVQVIMTSIVSIPECIPRLAFSGEGMPQAMCLSTSLTLQRAESGRFSE